MTIFYFLFPFQVLGETHPKSRRTGLALGLNMLFGFGLPQWKWTLVDHLIHASYSALPEHKSSIGIANPFFNQRRPCVFLFIYPAGATNFVFESRTSPNQEQCFYEFTMYVFAANAINCIYSSVQIALVMWELLKGNTLLPEMIQVWFDFGHDQVFAYLLLSASSAGTALAQNLRSGHIWIVLDHTCKDVNVFCIQSDIAISLGFGAFVFLASVCLLSGFRVACFIITNSRFHL